jgi:hypothetical protein
MIILRRGVEVGVVVVVGLGGVGGGLEGEVF